MKAFSLAFAFLLVAAPAVADELPQTGNAWRANEPGLAKPGSYQWTVVDDEAGKAAPASISTGHKVEDKSAPARAALAQIRAETARIMDEARRANTKVSRIRYDLRVRCLVEEVDVEPEALNTASLPYIWGSADDQEPTSGTIEMCEIDYSQRVRSQPVEEPAREPQMVDFLVAVPLE